MIDTENAAAKAGHFQCTTMIDDLKAMGLVLLNRGVTVTQA